MRDGLMWNETTAQSSKGLCPLTSLKKGDCGRIVAVEGGVKRRRKLMTLGLVPGRRFRFVRGGRFYPVCLSLDGTEIVFGSSMAGSILVRPV